MLRWKQSATQSRPEDQPITPAEPDPIAALKFGLRELKERDGNPSYRELAARTNYSHTVLSQGVIGKGMPTSSVTFAFVTACGGDENEWRKRWLIANESGREKPQKIRTSDGSELKRSTATVGSSSRSTSGGSTSRTNSRRAIADRAGFAPSTLTSVIREH